jgi:Domain of unknown function (DUF5122) beta-propeller
VTFGVCRAWGRARGLSRFVTLAALLGACLGVGAQSPHWTTTLPGGQVLRITEGATATASGYYLERRFGAGIRDPQFGNGGRTFFKMGGDNVPPATLRVDDAGRILVSGNSEGANGRASLVLLRFLPEGQFDPAWGQQGRSVIDAPRGSAIAADTWPLAGGQVLVIGTLEHEQTERAALWRVTDAGALDTGFGNAGLLLAQALPQSQGLSLQQDAQGTLHIALHTARDDKVWLEVHRWKPGAAGPVRASSQEFPEDWVGPPVLALRGASWVWTDASQPLTPPMELVAATPESVWTPAPGTAARVEPAAAAGHAAVNPFSDAATADPASAEFMLDDLVWPGMLLAIIGLLTGAFWWWWRRG